GGRERRSHRVQPAVRQAAEPAGGGRAAVPPRGAGIRPRAEAGRAGGAAGERGRPAARGGTGRRLEAAATARRSRPGAAGGHHGLAEAGVSGYDGKRFHSRPPSLTPRVPAEVSIMLLAKLTCPRCRAVLKPAKPVESGKTIKCPKCEELF